MPPPRRRRKRTPASEGSLIPTDSFVGARPPPPSTHPPAGSVLPPPPPRQRRRRGIPSRGRPFFSSPTRGFYGEESLNPLTLDSHPLYDARRPFRPLVVLTPGPDDATPYPVPRALASRQGSLESLSLQPFSSTPYLLATLLCSARISLRLAETFDSFGGNLHKPPPTFFSSLHRPIHRVPTRVRRYHTVHPRSTHIPHPSRTGFPTARDNNGTDLVVFYRTEGGRVPVYIVVIFFNRFRRIDLRRMHIPSWSRVDVTRQDHFRRRISFRAEFRATLLSSIRGYFPCIDR
ncbi:hypothetical protein X777_16114 [Ooceraea biroi]|uniref:Uncharacterized protein n=1 Tax=Ooceraea biroi TaxID=2015173 RepID=A0A026WW29_OOCBI|nr:hypothetical protein X777_16114 [Ooceraea biroi]